MTINFLLAQRHGCEHSKSICCTNFSDHLKSVYHNKYHSSTCFPKNSATILINFSSDSLILFSPPYLDFLVGVILVERDDGVVRILSVLSICRMLEQLALQVTVIRSFENRKRQTFTRLLTTWDRTVLSIPREPSKALNSKEVPLLNMSIRAIWAVVSCKEYNISPH